MSGIQPPRVLMAVRIRVSQQSPAKVLFEIVLRIIGVLIALIAGWVWLVTAFWAVVAGILLLILEFGPLVDLAQGHYEKLADPWQRGFICFSFLFWTYVYHKLSETPCRVLFGLLKVCCALWSNWIQLKKFAPPDPMLIYRLHLHHLPSPEGPNRLEVLAFIAAGLVAMASGFKDIAEGHKKFEEEGWESFSS